MTINQMIIFEEYKEAKKNYKKATRSKKNGLYDYAYCIGYYHATRLLAVKSGITIKELGE